MTSDLTFTINPDSSLLVEDDANPTVNTVQAVNVENLIGSAGKNSFKFLGAGTLAGSITGQTDGDDVLDFSGYSNPVEFNLQAQTVTGVDGTVINIAAFIGSLANGGDNTLIGLDDARLWEVTDTNEGTVNGVVFSNTQHLVGGASNADRLSYAGATTGADGRPCCRHRDRLRFDQRVPRRDRFRLQRHADRRRQRQRVVCSGWHQTPSPAAAVPTPCSS